MLNGLLTVRPDFDFIDFIACDELRLETYQSVFYCCKQIFTTRGDPV